MDAPAVGISAGERDWSEEPLHELVEHIISEYHVPLREELPRLERMASKVARVLGINAPHLVVIENIVSEIAAELTMHMRKEELVLFPAIAEHDPDRGMQPLWIAAPVAVLEREHDHVWRLFDELRRVTDDYRLSDWACATVRELYAALEALEMSMLLHIELEDTVLFRRALAGMDRVSLDD